MSLFYKIYEFLASMFDTCTRSKKFQELRSEFESQLVAELNEEFREIQKNTFLNSNSPVATSSPPLPLSTPPVVIRRVAKQLPSAVATSRDSSHS